MSKTQEYVMRQYQRYRPHRKPAGVKSTHTPNPPEKPSDDHAVMTVIIISSAIVGVMAYFWLRSK